MKIISIVGARPQFIKEAIVQKHLKKEKSIEHVLIHTGQHYDENMSNVFFKSLNMTLPKYNLKISEANQGKMTGRMIIEIERILINEGPDFVILYGDTNSTLAGAIAARKLGIKVVHIEAGLRQRPFDMPEEINRILTDRISDILFCTSEISVKNLIKENQHSRSDLINVGDVMCDIFRYYETEFDYSIIGKLGLIENEYVLLTLHRNFNVDDIETLTSILKGINKVNLEKKVVFPIHPRTAKSIKKFGLESLIENLIAIKPVDYFRLMALTKKAYKIITDSGGLQKEAYFSDKNALVIMEDTGWIELVEFGYNTLVGTDYNDIYKAFKSPIVEISNKEIYGTGDASEKIVQYLCKYVIKK